MTDDASSIEPWLNTLRGDVQPMSAEARERLGLRLASATVLVAAGAAAPALSSALHRGFWYSRAFTAAVALPLGVLVGAAGHAYLVPATIQVVSSAPAVSPSLALAPTPAPSAAAEPAPATPSLPRPSAPSAPSVKSEVAVPSLERELSLLERARSKLSEGEPQATLQLLGEHQGRYPTSVLQQEREALAIRALLAAGRRAEAQRRAQAFMRAYPTSALRGSLERIAGTIP